MSEAAKLDTSESEKLEKEKNSRKDSPGSPKKEEANVAQVNNSPKVLLTIMIINAVFNALLLLFQVKDWTIITVLVLCSLTSTVVLLTAFIQFYSSKNFLLYLAGITSGLFILGAFLLIDPGMFFNPLTPTPVPSPTVTATVSTTQTLTVTPSLTSTFTEVPVGNSLESEFTTLNHWSIPSGLGPVTVYPGTDILNLEDFGIHTHYDNSNINYHEFKLAFDDSSAGHKITMVRRINQDTADYSFILSKLNLQLSDECTPGKNCETLLFFGIGNPVQDLDHTTPLYYYENDQKYGKFIVFKKFIDNMGGDEQLWFCVQRTIDEPCDHPVKKITLNSPSSDIDGEWNIRVIKTGGNISLTVCEDEDCIHTDPMYSEQTKYFYFGFKTKYYGKVYATIDVPEYVSQ